MSSSKNRAKSQNLLAALQYARMGWHIFPLRSRSKAPLSAHGFKDATLDSAQIERWWAGVPNAGIGLATGYTSRILVLDVDPRNGGDETLKTLIAQYGEIPDTPCSSTGGGGKHYFFECDRITPSAPGLWPGIDVKADGGYVVLPFSDHPSGLKYTWITDPDTPLASPPEWLLEALTERRQSAVTQRKETATDDERIILEGTRNEALASLAGTMQRRGMKHESILCALLAENEARCEPPLTEPEVVAIVNSITRYEPDNTATPGERVGKPRTLYLAPVHHMATEDPPEIDWIIANRLARGDCHLLVGPPGVGKSWVTLELAITTACGIPIFGAFDTHPMRVLIVDEENPKDELHRRLRAITTAHEINPRILAENLHITEPSQGFSFRDPGYVRALTDQIEAIRPDLIIFDSLTAISSIDKENDAVQVRRFFHDRLYPLRALNGAAIVCIHHTSKAVYQLERQVAKEGLARGSIDLIAAVDSSLLLEPSPTGCGKLRLDALKVRRGKKPGVVLLEIVDGVAGGCRPLAQNVGPEGMTEGDSSKQARCREIIFNLLSRTKKIAASELSAWVRATAPELTTADVRAALRSMEAKSVISRDDDGTIRIVAGEV